MIPLLFVVAVTVATLVIGALASRGATSAKDMMVAGRSVGVGLNAAAISGEYLSAASFMGIAGLVMKGGYDALWYPAGYAAGYLFLLLFIAGPLRRFGAYTIPDFAQGRFDSPAFRRIAVLFVLFIGFFYTMPQMKGAGVTLSGILGQPYWVGVAAVGTVITFNVALGGMKGITLVQAFQYWLKLFAISAPLFVLASLAGFGTATPLGATAPTVPSGTTVKVKGAEGAPNNVLTLPTSGPISLEFPKGARIASIVPATKPDPDARVLGNPTLYAFERVGDIAEVRPDGSLQVAPGGTIVGLVPVVAGKSTSAKITFAEPAEVVLRSEDGGALAVPNAPADDKWSAPFGPLSSKHGHPLLWTYSLIVALVCGTAGLPHILVRFYTNPDGRAAKRTTLWVMAMLGAFYVFTPLWGAMGRALAPALYASSGTDSVVVKLPGLVLKGTGGEILAGVASAGAFAAFMSTFSGLLVSMSGAFAHDVYGRILRPEASPEARRRAFQIAAVVVGAVSMGLGLLVETWDIATMVGWAFAIGAASYFPLLLLGAWWRNLTMPGAAAGMVGGGLLSLAAIVGSMLMDKKVLPEASPLVRSLMEQPAIWGVPLSIGLMVLVSRATRASVPPDADAKMLRLHAPEELGLSRDYVV